MAGRGHRVVPALLRHNIGAAIRRAVAAAAVAVVRVTVTAREPVNQFFDRVHEEEARAHDELGEQAGHRRFRVERPVVGQPLDALPDLGQQVQERGAQQHAAAKVEYQPERGVRCAPGSPADAQPLEHAHGCTAGHERRHAQERHGQYFRQHRGRSIFVRRPLRLRRHREHRHNTTRLYYVNIVYYLYCIVVVTCLRRRCCLVFLGHHRDQDPFATASLLCNHTTDVERAPPNRHCLRVCGFICASVGISHRVHTHTLRHYSGREIRRPRAPDRSNRVRVPARCRTRQYYNNILLLLSAFSPIYNCCTGDGALTARTTSTNTPKIPI